MWDEHDCVFSALLTNVLIMSIVRKRNRLREMFSEHDSLCQCCRFLPADESMKIVSANLYGIRETMSRYVSALVSAFPSSPPFQSLKIGPSIIQRVYFDLKNLPRTLTRSPKEKGVGAVCIAFGGDCTSGISYG